MNHRERLIAALSHRQPDQVPIDIGGTVNSSIVVEGYAKLKQHYGINSEDVLCNRMMRVVKVDEQILQALDIDTRGVYMGAPIKGDDPGILQGLKERIDWIRKHTDCAAVLAVPPPFIHISQSLKCSNMPGSRFRHSQSNFVLDADINRT